MASTADPRAKWPMKTDEKNQVLLSAMKIAWEAGFTGGFSGRAVAEDEDLSSAMEKVSGTVDWWGFDKRPDPSSSSADKKNKRAPKKPSLKKPTGEPEELANLAYDPKQCRARKYNRGWPLQCWKTPGEEGGICHLCEARKDDELQDFWGYYDEPLENCCLNKDGKPHSWKALASTRAEKKSSDREDKKRAKMKEKLEKETEKEKKKKVKEEEKSAKQNKKDRLKKLKKKAKEENNKESDEEEQPVEPDAEAEKPVAAEKPLEVDAEEEEQQVEPDAEAEKPVAAEKPLEVDEEAEERDGPTYSPGSPRENPASEEEQSLDEDTQDLGDPDPGEIFEEYIHDGYTMKWNKVTNDLLDPDDDEILGKMVFDDDGTPTPDINVDESDDSDEE